MKVFLLVFLCFAITSCSSLQRKGTCNDPNAYPNKVVNKVDIKPYSGAPSFYYSANSFVVFVAPADMAAYLDQFNIKNTNQHTYKFLMRIRADVNLKWHKDLLQYDFDTWNYGMVIESLVIGLAKQGRVSVVSPGGRALDFVTVVEHNEPYINYTVVHAAEEGFNGILYERSCIVD